MFCLNPGTKARLVVPAVVLMAVARLVRDKEVRAYPWQKEVFRELLWVLSLTTHWRAPGSRPRNHIEPNDR
jgi:hypothetical protein